ncbi:hypothetical protein SDC9_168014 [bioreactor metagenome]|uniref:Uncharacterized protein n=1 Tax=bioreactor metagenome TaxID=1076179 RepID=A0A645G1X5_9ZZZZ
MLNEIVFSRLKGCDTPASSSLALISIRRKSLYIAIVSQGNSYLLLIYQILFIELFGGLSYFAPSLISIDLLYFQQLIFNYI